MLNKYISLTLLLMVALAAPHILHAECRGIDIVGVGSNPSSATRNGLRQICQVFGRCFLESESVVRNHLLEKDVIRAKAHFSGSKLDRFYEGVFRKGNKYFAIFRFPADFVETVQRRERDKARSQFFASFDVIKYSSAKTDSFGEVSGDSWRVKIPECVKRFVHLFLFNPEKIGTLEISRSNE